MDLHVDDGYMTRPGEKMMTRRVIVLIGVGDSFEHVGALRVIDEERMWARELDKYETSVLTIAAHRRVPSSRNRQSLETMIPAGFLSCTDQLCAQSST